MMTTIALIAGMIPVALGRGEGADFRAPLGRAVIGGVITSTLLTLLVIPTVYEILDNFRSWMTAKVWRRVVRTHPQTAAPAAKSSAHDWPARSLAPGAISEQNTSTQLPARMSVPRRSSFLVF